MYILHYVALSLKKTLKKKEQQRVVSVASVCGH